MHEVESISFLISVECIMFEGMTKLILVILTSLFSFVNNLECATVYNV